MFPFILALIAAALFGGATPVSKFLLQELTLPQLAGLLYLGSAFGVAIKIFWDKQGFLTGHLSKANRLRLLGSILFGGILGPLFLLWGLRLASSASVSLWLNLELVATVLLGYFFFHDHLGRWGWIGALLIGSAALALSWGEGAAGGLSILMLLCACTCWGLDNHWTSLIDGLLPTQSVFWKGLIAGGTNLLVGLVFGDFVASSTMTSLALFTGMLAYGASTVLYVTAAQSLGATRGQMIFASAPFFGLFFSRLLLGDVLTGAHFGAIGLQALGLMCLFRDKHSHFHIHTSVAHNHSHTHDDGHHDHVHSGSTLSMRHAHPHLHESVAHAHPHWPDLHHRHTH